MTKTMTAGSIDSGRLRRALHLRLERLGSGSFQIGGHVVDPIHGCSCPDARVRGTRDCKHSLRVRLRDVDDAVLDGLRKLIGEAR